MEPPYVGCYEVHGEGRREKGEVGGVASRSTACLTKSQLSKDKSLRRKHDGSGKEYRNNNEDRN
jgi:hypothetical protein